MSDQRYRGSGYEPEEETARARRGVADRRPQGTGSRSYERSGLAGRDFGDGAGEDFSGRGPRGYLRSGDRIREDVCEALTDERLVDASDIEVDVEDAVVTLSGTVRDRRQKRRAEDVAERAKGVRDVRNRLEISDDGMVGDLQHRAGSGVDSLGRFRDPSWRSTDFRGFSVEARDGSIGSVDGSTEVGGDHLVVDTGPWIFGRKVVLPAGLVQDVDFDDRRIFVSRSKDEIKNAPEFDERAVEDPEYGARLRSYYRSGEHAGEHSAR